MSINAQEAVLTSGGNASNASGSVSYSVGQVVYNYGFGSNGTVSQGVQQPFEISSLGTNSFPEISLQMSVYPNPTIANATLKIQGFDSENYQYQLLDINGKTIANNQITNSETSISLENLSSAIYFLNVLENNKTIKIIKIIKN
jgi:Secretion system C-terminal sorting domain